MIERSRVRSPNYPGISLEEAILFTRRIYLSAHQTRMDKETLFGLLGYGGESGRSLSVLSALRKFGLIIGDSNGLQVSDFALQILEPTNSIEEKNAIREAALKPEIFRDIFEFCGSSIPPNDEPIRAYLIRQRGFGQKGVGRFLKSFRSTIEFAELDNAKTEKSAEEINVELDSPEEVGVSASMPHQTSVGTSPIHSIFATPDRDPNCERLSVRISPTATAEIIISGEITQPGIRKLINFLELSIDNYSS